MKWNRNIDGNLNETTVKKSYDRATLSMLQASYCNACCCKQKGNLPLV